MTRIAVKITAYMEVSSENPHAVAEALIKFAEQYPGLLLTCEVEGDSLYARSGETLTSVMQHYGASRLKRMTGDRSRRFRHR